LTSSYTRALQTAAILSREQDLPIRVETDLHEWVANKNYTYETDERAEEAYQAFMEQNGEIICYEMKGESLEKKMGGSSVSENFMEFPPCLFV